MKKLTRLLLINWHFFRNVVIEFDNINFLTGKNSAGKSTIIDALQVVLLGETRSSAFNRAATKRSERTLKSYLIGSMGEDRDSGLKSLREGKDFSTYIVAEFFDDVKSEHFCLGAIFDSFSDGGDPAKRFFWLRSGIPEFHFIENGKTLNTKRALEYFRKNYPNKFETRDTAEAYRQIVLDKLNIHDRRFQSMLKKAISFEPINDIEKFITENVCDIEDDIDITAMQDNILYYKLQEDDADRFEAKLVKLGEIRDKFSKIENLRKRRLLQKFLIDYGNYDNLKYELNEAKKNLDKYNSDIEEFKAEYDGINENIKQTEEARDSRQNERNLYWADCNGELLEAEKKRYTEDFELYSQRIDKFILEFGTSAAKWSAKLEGIENADGLKKTLSRAEKLDEKALSKTSTEFFAKLREEYIELKSGLEPKLREIEDGIRSGREELSELDRQIEKLRRGIKPYPAKAEKLRSAISDGLKKKYGREIRVSFLADMLEIKDPEWSKAVEGYLNTQRMNIIVPPESFMDAYEIYKRVRQDGNIHEYAVVDLEKVYADRREPLAGSLAEIVKSDDKYVQAYVNYLLGRVMMCRDEKHLRDHPTSVTADCMLYRGYAVRSLNRDAYEEPYIGRESIEKQIKDKTERREEVRKSVNMLNEKADAVRPAVRDEWFLTESYLSTTVAAAFSDCEKKTEAGDELSEIAKKLEKINFFWLDEIDRKIKDLNDRIKELYDKRENVKAFIREYEIERDKSVQQTIPQYEKDIEDSEKLITETYPVEFVHNDGMPKYSEELLRCGSAFKVAKAFELPVKQTSTRIDDLEKELNALRFAYNASEQTAYRADDVCDNSEFEKAYNQIKDFELPKYRDRIKEARKDAMEQFKSDFLYKLRSNIQSAYERIDELNRALKKAQFGGETYRFEVSANPDYLEYYDMIMSPLLENGNVGLFSYDFMNKYESVIENLFMQIVQDDEGKTAQSVEIFSKYKTYLTFDLISRDDSGRVYKLSRNIFTKSGGETQTPFYLAVLASFAELYNVRNTGDVGNTARIVIFDEAFNKMDGERIVESVKLLRDFGLQAIICSPPEKAQDIGPVSDRTLLVIKETTKEGYNSKVYNWSIDREAEL